MKLLILPLSLLLLHTACTDSAVTAAAIASGLTDSIGSTMEAQPSLKHELIAFDGRTATVDVWFVAAPGTVVSSLELKSVTLDGKSPVESLPVRLGPVAAGQRAKARLHFDGPVWKAYWFGIEGEATYYETVFAYAAATSHQLAGREVAATAECSASMPLPVRGDSPLHAEMMRCFGDGRRR